MYNFPKPPVEEELTVNTRVGDGTYNFIEAMSGLMNTPGVADRVRACISLIIIDPEEDGEENTMYIVSANVINVLDWPTYMAYLDRAGFDMARNGLVQPLDEAIQGMTNDDT